jgi:hypothetical protein
MSAPETTPQDIESTAQRLGWSLLPDEAAKVARGVNRNRRWNDAVREYLTPELEPATIFAARKIDG